MTYALAALLKFYDVKEEEEGFFGVRENGEKYPVKDDKKNLQFFEKIWQEKDITILVERILANKDLWYQDLTEVEGLKEAVTTHLHNILTLGTKETLKSL